MVVIAKKLKKGTKKKKAIMKKATAYEKAKATAHKGKHIGGPGKEDYRRGNVKGEVKNRKTPVTKPELKKMVTEKGIKEVESKAGFTKPAKQYRNTYQPEVKLFQKGKLIPKKKPKKKK